MKSLALPSAKGAQHRNYGLSLVSAKIISRITVRRLGQRTYACPYQSPFPCASIPCRSCASAGVVCIGTEYRCSRCVLGPRHDFERSPSPQTLLGMVRAPQITSPEGPSSVICRRLNNPPVEACDQPLTRSNRIEDAQQRTQAPWPRRSPPRGL